MGCGRTAGTVSPRRISHAGGAIAWGELVQIDGSEHAWFEDRGPPCTLLAFVDDATSRLMQLRFVASESAFDYFRTMRAYLEEHGKPVAFYNDKHGIFRVNSKDAAGGDGVTRRTRPEIHRRRGLRRGACAGCGCWPRRIRGSACRRARRQRRRAQGAHGRYAKKGHQTALSQEAWRSCRCPIRLSPHVELVLIFVGDAEP
jgi:hypothetical protein